MSSGPDGAHLRRDRKRRHHVGGGADRAGDGVHQLGQGATVPRAAAADKQTAAESGRPQRRHQTVAQQRPRCRRHLHH